MKTVLSALSQDIDDRDKELYTSLFKDKSPEIKNPEDFYFQFMYPHEKFLRGLIQVELSNDPDVKFILMRGQFLEHHFEKWIERIEGHACCADKSRTIMKSLFDFYLNRKPIVFNYEQEYTYHLPSKIFKTEDEIVTFYTGLKHLYYGNPTDYLKAIADLTKLL